MKRFRKHIAAVLFLIMLSGGLFWLFQRSRNNMPTEITLMMEWYDLALQIESEVEGIAVPVAARFYGYFGFLGACLLATEHNDLQMLQQQFPELKLPETKDQKQLNFGIAFNKAARLFISRYYINVPYHLNKKADELEERWYNELMEGQDPAILEHSKHVGRDVANAVYLWSAEDDQGHQAYLHNFDKEYIPPAGPGKWQPDDEHPMPALLPHWGRVRTFVADSTKYSITQLPPYTTDHSSVYYSQALELFTISAPLSYENKWIAEFWSDDVRGLTFTPSGRWISILNQYLVQNATDKEKAVEAYFKTGIAMSDALVACWNAKYKFNLERPESYIRKNIHDDWRSFHHSPNFPSYPSGHSALGGACSSVLINMFGDHIDFTDFSHKDRIEFLGNPREYDSFSAMAEESAYSRIPLGVHYRMDCQEGLRLGSEIGKWVKELKILCKDKKMARGPISSI
ncbi:MAG: vanadium-dependent haloperoxidase [Saprospiraceae bacterium]|jgi:membrane-associated phospholipid phosphatase|nr:vanadium-dependent haloperoxidase [Saprospiraceae bacterium]MBP9194667.1 vanadium-dependent haloperoxidase [Saprospiraceae bacterium]